MTLGRRPAIAVLGLGFAVALVATTWGIGIAQDASDGRLDGPDSPPTAVPEPDGETNETNVSLGQQISLVGAERRVEVRRAYEDARFDVRLERAEDERRVIDRRARELRERADSIVDARDDLVESFAAGEIRASAFVVCYLLLEMRAAATGESVERVRVSAAETGVETETLDGLAAELAGDNVTATAHLRAIIAGERRGDLELRLHREPSAVRVEVRRDGERRIDYETGDRDGNGSIRLTTDDAIDVATAAVSADRAWWVRRVGIDESSGVYELRLADERDGRARVVVDASSGTVLELSERLTLDRRTGEYEVTTAGDIDLDLDGPVAPGERVTVTATAAGSPVADAVVERDGRRLGRTDDEGQLSVPIPADAEDDVRIRVETDERRGELTIDFGERAAAGLSVFLDGEIAPGETVTLTARVGGESVRGAEVRASHDGDRVPVGRTDGAGQLELSVPDDEEVEIRVSTDETREVVRLEFPRADEE